MIEKYVAMYVGDSGSRRNVVERRFGRAEVRFKCPNLSEASGILQKEVHGVDILVAYAIGSERYVKDLERLAQIARGEREIITRKRGITTTRNIKPIIPVVYVLNNQSITGSGLSLEELKTKDVRIYGEMTDLYELIKAILNGSDGNAEQDSEQSKTSTTEI